MPVGPPPRNPSQLPQNAALGAEGYDEGYNYSQEDADAESQHFEEVVQSFRVYQSQARFEISKHEEAFRAIPKEHVQRIPDVVGRFKSLKEAVDCNALFLRHMLEGQLRETGLEWEVPIHEGPRVKAINTDKVRGTLKSFVRDWSEYGEPERTKSYGRIIRWLENEYKDVPIEERHRIRIVCPGCGLGRLPWELAQRGFSAVGNEFSYHMLLGSNWVLNRAAGAGCAQIFPWVLSSGNSWNLKENRLRAIRVPDCLPSHGMPPTAQLSMVAGEFIEALGNEVQKFDCIATAFFLDTAHNVVEYIEVIKKMLNPGGAWVNFGPLLWHYDAPESIELSYDEIMHVIRGFGFEVVEESSDMCGYTCDRDSMYPVVYNCAFFVVKKPK